MWRNREFRIVIIIQLLLICIATYFIAYQKRYAVEIGIALGLGLMIINVVFTFYRYQRIKKTTHYLERIQHGEVLELRDNREGELSILKNEIYKLSVKLNHQAELLQRDKTYLADALSDISHQMKTPLTSMLMMVDLLEEDLPLEKRIEFTRNIGTGLERMEWLVQALLKLSKLDANAVIFRQERIHIAKLIEDAVRPLAIGLELREVSIEYNLSPSHEIQGDFKWLSEAFANLIKNCMEHTPRGGTVTISSEENNFYTKIVVSDTGEGIASEDLPHIFERFYRGKNAGKDSVGIGLALAKQIINQQNASIDVSSKVGVGSQFEIRFYSSTKKCDNIVIKNVTEES